MTTKVQVAVVGASLAGSAAAIMLGRAGVSVALIDKSDFPRRKPCGEGLCSYGIKQLELLGLGGKLAKVVHTPYRGYRVRSGKRTAIIKAPWGPGIAIQRTLLDEMLFQQAASFPTVQPYLGVRVGSVSGDSLSSSLGELSYQFLIVADGSSSTLAKQLGASERRYGPARSGVTATFKGAYKSPPGLIDISVKAGHQIYCTPVSDELLNVSVLVDLASGINPRDLLMAKDTLAEAFAITGFSGELLLPPAGRTGIGNVRRSLVSPNSYLVGDAREEFDPVGGMGMSHALRSGIVAAESIISSLGKSAPGVDGLKRYDQDTARIARPMRQFTMACEKTLRVAIHHPVALSLASSSIAGSVMRYLTRELL